MSLHKAAADTLVAQKLPSESHICCSKMLLRVFLTCLLVSQSVSGLPKLASVQAAAARSSSDAAVSGPIDDLLIALLEQLRSLLPEPLPLGDLAIDVDSPSTIIHANITDAVLHNLSTFIIDNVHVNMFTLKAAVALSLPTLSLDCNYYIDSRSVLAELFPLYGGGPCSVALGNLAASVDADLKHNRSDGSDHYQIEALDFNLHFDTLDIQIHNLFDNDELATVIDEFADDFGPLLVDILVNDTRRDLLPTIIDELNDLLWNASLPLAETPAVKHFQRWTRTAPSTNVLKLTSSANANSFFDNIIPNLQTFIVTNSLDPMPLPEMDAEILGNTGVKLYNGFVNGLSSVHRTADAHLVYDEVEWLSVDGGLGFDELVAGYSLKIEVFGIGPHVSAEIHLTGTKAEFQAQISSQDLAIELGKLRVSDIGSIRVIIHGLSLFGWLIDPIIDLIINLFRGPIADAISDAMFSAVNDMLSEIDLLAMLENL
ncbi:uncharacterized protein LOC122366858 isoform X2 [Amphibalanus amphitrite]|uniref:uncharacterized protein LOC122366858 isoform X2 n=1 Tax=Amphibalanus amphitrite TaxID=1232801 RepID=UPI001C91257C|nr:uncharacterized protein LOC122366858 isoform X2 [Amphibalanus amphitrite]